MKAKTMMVSETKFYECWWDTVVKFVRGSSSAEFGDLMIKIMGLGRKVEQNGIGESGSEIEG